MDDEARQTYQVRVATDVAAAMRDGTILRADVAWPVPRASGETFPVLLMRTPYQKQPLAELAAAGYIAVSQDVRGRYASDGAFEPVHQMCGASIDRDDGHDTVIWASRLESANGLVGVFGTSYPAWEAWELAIARPPALKAMYVSGMSVTSTAVEGIPRPGRRLQWHYYSGAPDLRRRLGLPGHHTREAAERLWEFERHKWLWFLPWSDLPDHVLGPLTPYFKELFQHPERDHFRFAGRHGDIDIPIFHRTGWYDRFVSTIDHFVAMQQQGRSESTRQSQRLLVGPWGHTTALTRQVGDVDFGPAAEMDDRALMLRWFDHWLKGRDTGVLEGSAVRYFMMGRNEWRDAGTWPPATRIQRWYLRSGGGANTAFGDGTLVLEPPGEGEATEDRYGYDPRDPVPTIWPLGDQNLPLDHRPLDWRADLLVYVTAPLAQPLEVTGNPEVVLYAASTARDTDFIARLLDVHPDGFVQPLCYGIVRARYRDGFDRPQLLTPGAVERYTIRLHPVAFCIQPGHRLRLDVTSSDFPNYDRNHNTGDDDFADATLVVAHQTIYHHRDCASHLALPVAAMGDGPAVEAAVGL